jgi:proteasome lid subunit RPN8/RPN11
MFGWLRRIKQWWTGEPAVSVARQHGNLAVTFRLERIILTDGVAHTLFNDYAEHRRSERGEEEIGWILLGLRQGAEAIALAAIPSGTQRDAGAAHIHFNSEAQALASRIVRQKDKRLQIIGVVHTHPGSLRTPSGGDFEGDRQWVRQLRGGEGVFAIGTADARPDEPAGNHLQVAGPLCFHWYALGAGDARYRPLRVQATAGSDMALPLRPVWNTIESLAEPLNRLCRQFVSVQMDIIDEGDETLLGVKFALAAPNQQLRLLLTEDAARYYWDRNGELTAIDPREPQLDRAVYLILAELARECAPLYVESP